MSDSDKSRCSAFNDATAHLSNGVVGRWLGCSETAVRLKRAGALRVSDLDLSLLPSAIRSQIP